MSRRSRFAVEGSLEPIDYDGPSFFRFPEAVAEHVAELASTTRHTVEREIHRGNLRAKKIGRTWVVQPDDAKAWAAAFTPYASLRKSDGQDQDDAEA